MARNAAKHGLDTRAAGTRERILEVAKVLFAREGFHGASMQDVADAAGVSKANLYHHFQDKEALYRAVLQTTCDDKQTLVAAFEQDGEAIEERLDEFIRQHLELILADPSGFRLLLHEVLESGPEQGRVLAEDLIGTDFDRFVALLQQGQASGAWRRDVDPAFLATLLVAANVFFFHSREVLRHLSAVDFADDPERYAAMAADVLLKGIRRSGAEPDAEGD